MTTERADGRISIVLSGELDIASAEDLAAEFDAAEQGATRVIIDLSRLTFMDSTGLRAILRIDSVCRDRGTRLSFFPGPPAVQRVFELSRTLERLPFADGD